MPGCRAEYRQKFKIKGFRFGGSEKACAMVAAVRGNEVQQMYVCALLVKKLCKLEEQGAIAPGNELLVVPCVNHFSMNVGSRFWAMDKTDINRMFPGYDQGETTQRIAAALFQAVQGYKYGIHFASFYLPGDFVPHVRIMNTGYQMASLSNLFGLPYADVVRVQDFYPRPPRGGRRHFELSALAGQSISIRALREEGDRPAGHLPPPVRYFYPRPP